MVQHLEISGVHMDVSEDLRKYITKKIGRLDRFMSKSSQASAHIEVKLKEAHQKGKKECICEVVLHLPHEIITINESTINIFAAVDIAETKLRAGLKKYKELHGNPRLHRRILIKFKRQAVEV